MSNPFIIPQRIEFSTEDLAYIASPTPDATILTKAILKGVVSFPETKALVSISIALNREEIADLLRILEKATDRFVKGIPTGDNNQFQET